MNTHKAATDTDEILRAVDRLLAGPRYIGLSDQLKLTGIPFADALGNLDALDDLDDAAFVSVLNCLSLEAWDQSLQQDSSSMIAPGALLRGLSVRGHSYSHLDLEDACLFGSDFSGASIGSVVLDGADLRMVDFRNATIGAAHTSSTTRWEGANIREIDAPLSFVEEANSQGAALYITRSELEVGEVLTALPKDRAVAVRFDDLVRHIAEVTNSPVPSVRLLLMANTELLAGLRPTSQLLNELREHQLEHSDLPSEEKTFDIFLQFAEALAWLARVSDPITVFGMWPPTETDFLSWRSHNLRSLEFNTYVASGIARDARVSQSLQYVRRLQYDMQ